MRLGSYLSWDYDFGAGRNVGGFGLTALVYGNASEETGDSPLSLLNATALCLSAGAVVEQGTAGQSGGFGAAARISWGWLGPARWSYPLGGVDLFAEYRVFPGAQGHQDLLVGLDIDPVFVAMSAITELLVVSGFSLAVH